jgi:LmbE family N-acetylglucosaminyl deacetylase
VRDEPAIWDAALRALTGVDAVLLPGFPLLQADHRWVSFTALDRLGEDVPLGFYVDQPYAVWEAIGSRTPLARLSARLGQALRRPSVRHRQLPHLDPGLAERRGEAEWETLPVGLRARARKLRALRAYRSQLRGFGLDFIPQIMLYEWADGGEPIGWAAEPAHIISTPRADTDSR